MTTTTRIAAHAIALVLAATATIGSLAGMERLADTSYAQAQEAAMPVQQVVVVGQRASRG